MDTQNSSSFTRLSSTTPLLSFPASSRPTTSSAQEIRDRWGDEVFEVLVGIVMTMHARKGGSK